MFLYFIFALALSEENGVSDLSGQFLPLAPKSQIEAKGVLLDYPDYRIPLQSYFRFVSSYSVTGDATFGLATVFGYATPTNGDHPVNVTAQGIGGRISNEDQTSFLYACHFTEQIDTCQAVLELWAQLTNNEGKNVSVLLFNETVDFYEVINVREQIISTLLYIFFVCVIGGILYFIFSKDKPKESKPPSKKQGTKKKDYADIVKGSSNRSRSPSPGGKKGSQNK